MDDEALHGSMAGACKIIRLRFLVPCRAACARISRRQPKGGPRRDPVPAIHFDWSKQQLLAFNGVFFSLCSCVLHVNSLRSLSFKTSWT
jgi:hypothetical protein